MEKTILMIGAFDTKGAEYAFLRERILERGHTVVAVNTGVLATTERFPVDVEADEVARAGQGDLKALRERKDRGEAMKVMTAGAPVVVRSLYDEGRFDAIIGMGGGGGSTSTIPQIAPAAREKITREMRLTPATSTIEGTITMSLVPT